MLNRGCIYCVGSDICHHGFSHLHLQSAPVLKHSTPSQSLPDCSSCYTSLSSTHPWTDHPVSILPVADRFACLQPGNHLSLLSPTTSSAWAWFLVSVCLLPGLLGDSSDWAAFQFLCSSFQICSPVTPAVFWYSLSCHSEHYHDPEDWTLLCILLCSIAYCVFVFNQDFH